MDIPLPGGGGEVSEDYSPAATVVPFNPPLPLLRAPVPSSSSASTDPMPVLAFRDAASWRAAWEAAEASLFSQCEEDAKDWAVDVLTDAFTRAEESAKLK
ncbi:uncharacterized protein LOC123400112 isoform X4 [Hordeum vulgare subsp. vulgare]|uniref:uncharacterized protein LOC123400112 isoform X4 n=1 Tax=Hordeum vulgare subsp. vulgare TaxID=112509 RepID=UPI001D1A4B1A|nr:uncharacterized protein LOC123400112 isoform X4 [Hordeum vulgare subsp. vulgare]